MILHPFLFTWTVSFRGWCCLVVGQLGCIHTTQYYNQREHVCNLSLFRRVCYPRFEYDAFRNISSYCPRQTTKNPPMTGYLGRWPQCFGLKSVVQIRAIQGPRRRRHGGGSRPKCGPCGCPHPLMKLSAAVEAQELVVAMFDSGFHNLSRKPGSCINV